MKSIRHLIIALIATQLISACSSPKVEHVVEVTAQDFSFEVLAEIPSGWTTFKFYNKGHAEHFFLLSLLPNNISYEIYVEEVIGPFGIVFDSLKVGISKERAGTMLVELIPSWYFTSVKQMGGTGIVGPGKTAITKMKLEQGTYVMECYIKEKGVFHSSMGMIKQLKVTFQSSNMGEPDSDMEITIKNFDYEIKGTPKLGVNTVAVHFKEHPEFGLGNDVHLIRINDTTDIEEVVYWLDWMNIEGMQPPSPVEFLGGTQEMPVGFTSYFTVDLEPGNYAWIAESSADKGMVLKFKVE